MLQRAGEILLNPTEGQRNELIGRGVMEYSYRGSLRDGVNWLGYQRCTREPLWLIRRGCLVNGQEVPVEAVVCGKGFDAGEAFRRLAWEARCERTYRPGGPGVWECMDPTALLGLFPTGNSDRGRLQAWIRRAERGVAVRSFECWVEGFSFIVNGPVAHRDDDRRLHREDGPAIEWPEGTSMQSTYAWHGTRVPREIIEVPVGDVNDELIRRQWNTENRRVLIERRYGGMEQYMKALGASPVQKDETGELYYINPREQRFWQHGERALRTVGEMAYVRVVCTSTGREYWLRVPPATQTAKEGVAWTFEMEPGEYAPVAEA